MTVQNPDTEDKTETQEKQEATEDKALEFALKIESEEITFDDIDDDSIKAEIHERFIIGSEEMSQPDGNVESGKDDKEENQVVKKEESTAPIKDEEQEFLQKRKDGLDELNTIRQKIDAQNRKLEEMGKLSQTKEKKKFDDVLSEEAMESVISRLNETEKRQNEYFAGKTEEVKASTQDLEREKLYLELSNFQFENSDLKTEKPVKVLNAQYKKFIDDIGGVDNVDKFLTDKDYRVTKEAEGFNFPMSDVDYKKFDQISKVNAFRNEKKYPSLTSAYHDYQLANGIVLDKVQQTAIETAKATVEKFDDNSSATTLSPDEGSVVSGKSEMSNQDMHDWLIKHPEPKTAEERAKAALIHSKIMGGVK